VAAGVAGRLPRASASKERAALDDYNKRWYKRRLTAPIDQDRLPRGMKVFGGVLCVGAAIAFVNAIYTIVAAVQYFLAGNMDALGLSTTVVVFTHLAIAVLLDAAFTVFGVQIFKNKRRYAAIVIYGVHILLIGAALCSVMLYGVTLYLLGYGAMFAILTAFQIFLDPSLREERKLQRILRDANVRVEQEEGVLGFDETGKGYITLDFFNLFWIFVVASIFGDVMETLFHYFCVVPGQWQDRAGLLYGPFSPIYGCGALLMTLALNRFRKNNLLTWVSIFFAAAIIGGAFEYFVSVFMQYTYGAVAWDYTGQWLSIGGRTCGLAMAAWGAIGLVWMKGILPVLVRFVNKIPWNWRYTVTSIAAVLMAVDVVMTLQALDCWYERLSGDSVNTQLQHFYANHYNNDYMANRFQSMSITPDDAVRHGKV
jgi:uncharacterized membrane protein